MSRRNYYKQRWRHERQAVDEQLIVELVTQERAAQPCLGGRKSHHLLLSELEDAGVVIGWDRFFEVLRK